jgi:hypothetical protein
MLTSQQVNSWAVVFPSKMKRDVTEFVSALQLVAAKMELRLPQPYAREMSDCHIASYMETLENAALTCNPKLILVVIPNNQLERYRYVKIVKSCDL